VVEDEYFIAQDLQASLEDAGAQVVGPAADVASAMTLIEGETVDCAVLDINLHGRVDFDLAAELTRRAIPFLFATGYEVASIPKQFETIPLWRKPFRTEELVEAVTALRARQ
jgi:DNA-binding response OmpR family regulator